MYGGGTTFTFVSVRLLSNPSPRLILMQLPSKNSFLISKKATNSNLDHFINLASNPFTTKFEFTASNKKKSLTIKSTSSNNIVNLDEEKKKRVNNFGLKFLTQTN